MPQSTLINGLSIAATAAALFAAAPTPALAAEQGAEALIHCHGVNACRERGNCKSAENKCKAQNACKGQGFVPVSAAVCEQLGGVSRND